MIALHPSMTYLISVLRHLIILGIIRAVGEAAELAGVSIHAILQNPITNPSNLDFVVTTESVKLSQVQLFAENVAKLPFASKKPILFPILG